MLFLVLLLKTRHFVKTLLSNKNFLLIGRIMCLLIIISYGRNSSAVHFGRNLQPPVTGTHAAIAVEWIAGPTVDDSAEEERERIAASQWDPGTTVSVSSFRLSCSFTFFNRQQIRLPLKYYYRRLCNN